MGRLEINVNWEEAGLDKILLGWMGEGVTINLNGVVTKNSIWRGRR